MSLLSFEASLLARVFEFSIAFVVNVFLSPFEFVLRGHVTDGAVQTPRIVVLDVVGDEPFGVVEGQRRSGSNAFLLEGFGAPLTLAAAFR